MDSFIIIHGICGWCSKRKMVIVETKDQITGFCNSCSIKNNKDLLQAGLTDYKKYSGKKKPLGKKVLTFIYE